MPNLYCPNKSCTYYGGSGLIISMQPEYHKVCPYCDATLTQDRPLPRDVERSLRWEPEDDEPSTDEVLPSFVHFTPDLERSYSDVEDHLSLIDLRSVLRRSSSSTLKPKKLVRRDFKRPRHCVMDELDDCEALTVTKGVPYHDDIHHGVEFLRTKMVSVALTYSAYFTIAKNDTGPCNFLLGWDHAMILKRKSGGWYAHSVYSSKYTGPSSSAEAKVWRISHLNPAMALSNGTKLVMPGMKMESTRTWYGFDVQEADLQVAHIVTLGLTSCSFACLFNDEYILISHMSSKTIPVAWLASVVLGLDDSIPLKLLVSHHGDWDEFRKFSTTDGMPCAETLSIDSILCSRGVKHLGEEVVNTPSLSHPYMGLNLTAPDQPSCFCVLGYNNDPGLHIEMPPLHIVWPNFFNKLKATKDTQLVLDILCDCHQGNYGFDELYKEMFAELVAEHSRYKIAHKNKDFTSPLIELFASDLKETSSWRPFIGTKVTPAKAALPDPLKGWAHICFLMIDVIQHMDSQSGPYRLFTLALLRGWNNYQKGFNFDLSEFDSFEVPEPRVRSKPKHLD